ncbi:unnamed protein product, partial [Owenia fusiformis]
GIPNMASGGKSQKIHVHEIPYDIRFELCRILDPNNNWKKIAGKAGFSNDDIAVFALAIQRPGSSPSDEFLTNWGHRLPTISHFFNILVDLHLLREASLLKHLVPEKCLQRLPGYQKTEDYKHSPSDTDKRETPSKDDQLSLSKSANKMDDSGLPMPLDPDEPPESESSNDLNKPDSTTTETLYKASAKHKQFVPLKSEAEPQECSEHQTTQSNKVSSTSNQEVPVGGSSNQNRLDGSCLTNQNICHSEPIESLDTNTTTYRRDSGNVSSIYSQHTDAKARPRTESIKETNLPKLQAAKETSTDVFQIHPDQYFSSKELSQATGGFSTKHVIGQGGFGTTFTGIVRNTQVAIKKLTMWDGAAEQLRKLEESKPGIFSLFRLQHNNIIRLYGCCLEMESVCLVYEHLEMGSLSDCLHKEKSTIPWQQRHRVLLGVAMGLQYLHEMGVIHGDIKSSNILLTPQFEVKLTDFGLTCHMAKQTDGKTTHVTVQESKRHMFSSKHYMPHEFFQSGFKLYPQTDVFSFGVVVYEICTGQPVYSEKLGESLVDYMEENLDLKDKSKSLGLKDSTVSDWPEGCFLALLTLGKDCTVAKRKNRPTASKILEELEHIPITEPTALPSNTTLLTKGSFQSDPGPRSLYETPRELQSVPSEGSTTPDSATPSIGITSLPNASLDKTSLGSEPNKHIPEQTEHMSYPIEHMSDDTKQMSNPTKYEPDPTNHKMSCDLIQDSPVNLFNVQTGDDQSTPSCEEIKIKGKKKSTIFEMYDCIDDENPLSDSAEVNPLDGDGMKELVSKTIECTIADNALDKTFVATTSGVSTNMAESDENSPGNIAIATENILSESSNEVSSSDDVVKATTFADDNKQHNPADSTVQDPNLSKIMRKNNLLMNEFDNADVPSLRVTVHERARRDDVTQSIDAELNEMLKQRCAKRNDRNDDTCETVITSMNLNSPIMSTMCKDM